MASIRTTNINDILTIKKTAQIQGHNPKIRFLTTYHPLSNYGQTQNPNEILKPGTQLIVIGKGKPQTKYRQSYVTVIHNNQQFDIFSSDLKRFCK